METIAVLLELALLGVGWLVLRAVKESADATRRVWLELHELRTTGRTRVGVTRIRNTVESDEAKLVRLGRSTRARRVVVGGDEDSPLRVNLMRSLKRPGDDRKPADMPEAPAMPEAEGWRP